MDGVIPLDKPVGLTSHDVVNHVRRTLGVKKVGHTGTLDPFASGILLVCMGKATRLVEYLAGWTKEYEAVLRLGEKTDTQDLTGRIIEKREVGIVDEGLLCSILAGFKGRIEQCPPMYSAVKVNGVPLYRLAREGKEVLRKPRTVEIYDLELTGLAGQDVYLRIKSSKGTYIRTLCSDIADLLGTGGHLVSLRRTKNGALSVEESLTIDNLEEMADRFLISLSRAIEFLPAIIVDDENKWRVSHGSSLKSHGILHVDAEDDRGLFRVIDNVGNLIAVGAKDAGNIHGTVDDSREIMSETFKVQKVFIAN